MSPFLEIGANAGHTSYMLCNEFGAEGFALDISADALRHGMVLQDQWGMSRAPVRIAGDAVNLPFADGSLRLVMTFQTLSQFMDIDAIFREVKRVLAPGGVFLFAEEPIRRLLSLRLYRCPYYDTMKPWERKLYDWGLLGYLVQDVIGANQEESFGIRQNHTMYLNDWNALVEGAFRRARVRDLRSRARLGRAHREARWRSGWTRMAPPGAPRGCWAGHSPASAARPANRVGTSRTWRISRSICDVPIAGARSAAMPPTRLACTSVRL